MNLEGKTILLTGGTGFIGSRLVEKLILQHKAHVRVIARNYSKAMRIARFPVDILAADVTDKDTVIRAMENCDIVFHCAHDSVLTAGPQRQMAIQGTMNVAQAALQHNVSRMVHVSTFAVYGTTPAGDLLEQHSWQPVDQPYTLAKRAAEKLVLEMYEKEHLPVVVVQPTIVYGPYCRPWTTRPIKQLQTMRIPLIDGGQGYCNAVYIDDCVDAMILAATQKGILGQVFLISGEKPVTWREFYGAFEEMLGYSSSVSLSMKDMQKLTREKERSKRTVNQLIKMAQHPKVMKSLTAISAVKNSLNFVKKQVSESRWQQIEASLYHQNGKLLNNNGKTHKEIFIPERTEAELFNSRSIVKIDKAKKMLNYEPKFDLRKGMSLTEKWARWAHLFE